MDGLRFYFTGSGGRMKSMLWTFFAFGLLTVSAYAKTWVLDSRAFREIHQEGIGVDGEGRCVLAKDSGGRLFSNATFTSAVFDSENEGGLCFIAWVSHEVKGNGLSVEFRGSPKSFGKDDAVPVWAPAENSAPISGAESRKYFQVRALFSSSDPEHSPALREIFMSSKSLKEMGAGLTAPTPENMLSTMIYQATMEKVDAVYRNLSFNTSERGMYVFRNQADVPIREETYRYRCGVSPALEMYLPERFGTRIVLRVHPIALWNKLSIMPRPAVLRSKAGEEKTGSMDAAHSINIFDDAYLDEYAAGLGAMVAYYRVENPYVFAYTLAPPEFFYDTEPWPQMTYLGGFGALAKTHYHAFQKRLGREVSQWPDPSDGDVSLSPDYYLWAYWRARAAGDYICRLAHVVRQKDPRAWVGTVNYLETLKLRGLEPAFVETCPDFDYYYSSNLYPRVPDTNGWYGGTTFSCTRLNVNGNSKKLKMVEYDLYSPYVDFKRSLVFARYAQLQGILPVPFVLGEYPTGSKPTSFMTKYHGMKAEPLTPAVLAQLGENVRETSPLRDTRTENQVALILPTISTFAVLEKSRWMAQRLQQLSLHLLSPLLALGVPFDFLTEGYASTEILDRYKLVIVFQPAVYPWMRNALAETKANILALGWAGTVAPPGPYQIDGPIEEKSFSMDFSSAWPRLGQTATATTIFPTGGRVEENDTTVQFSKGPQPLLAGLENKKIEYAGAGLAGRPLPYVADLKGEVLAKDSNGKTVFSVLKEKGREVIHLGVMPYFRDRDGKERGFFSDVDENHFVRNILDECSVEYFPDLGPLRVMKTSRFLMIENTGDKAWFGTPPKPVNARPWNVDSKELQIPPLESVVIEVHAGP